MLHPGVGVQLLIFLLLFSGCSFWPGYGSAYSYDPSHAQLAEDLRAEGKWAEAIVEYRKHIEMRQNDPRKPARENPQFYLIYISDCYRQLGDPVAAEAALSTALQSGVEPALIVDRVKTLAQWHEQRAEYDAALELLQRYRQLDDLAIDIETDRIHRKSVEAEEQRNLFSR